MIYQYQHQHFGTSEYFCKLYGKDINFPMHSHRSFELMVVLSGGMTAKISERMYELNAGEAAMIFPNQPHAFASARSEHMLFIFSPDIVRSYYASLPGMYPVNHKITLPPYLLGQFRGLEKGSSTVRIKAALYTACALLDENTDYIQKENIESSLLARIFDFVENNYDRDCTLLQVSRVLGYSSSYISRYFKDTTDMTYIAFVNQYRIGKACDLLANTDKSVMECSLESGYPSLRNFNRNFKTHVGLSPKEYRAANHKFCP